MLIEYLVYLKVAIDYIVSRKLTLISVEYSFTALIMLVLYRKQEYGLTLLMSTDAEVNKYLDSVLAQIKDWLEQRKV